MYADIEAAFKTLDSKWSKNIKAIKILAKVPPRGASLSS